jgi:hypothetical protein
MITSYRNKALVWLGVWAVITTTWVTLLILQPANSHAAGEFASVLPLGGFVLQTVCFLWCCRDFLKAKAQPSAILLIGLLVPIGQLALPVVLYLLADRTLSSYHDWKPADHGRRAQSDPAGMSSRGRLALYRMKAWSWIVPGLVGIALAVLLTLVHFVDVADYDDQLTVALFVFVAAYIAMLRGCAWLTKAKGWHDALVFIGLMPLTILFIPLPGKALLFEAAAPLLPLIMVLMPIIMLAVIVALPDKSGAAHRRTPRQH